MASLTKTIQTAPISLQSVASGSVVISSAVDVSTLFAATVLIHFGRRASTALTTSCNIRVEASAKSSGDGHWFPLAVFASDTVAAEPEALTGTVSAAQNVLTLASTTNLSVGDIIYIDNGTIANSEWGRIKVVTSNTSVTIEDNLVNAQTSSTIYNKGQITAFQLDLSAVKRIRVVVDNTGTGQAVAVEVQLITLDSIG